MYPGLYLKLDFIFLAIWLTIYMLKTSQRREMLLMSVILAVAGPIQELWYTKDYWHPNYIASWPWAEDIIFGFAAAGIATVIYEAVFSRHIKEAKKSKPHPLAFIAVALIATMGMSVFTPYMNSIYAAMLAFIIAWGIIIFLRRDLMLSSIVSGLLMVVLSYVGYSLILYFRPDLIQAWWYLGNISGLLIKGIPLEEFLWFFTLGLAFGPAYELLKGISFKYKK